MPIKFRCYQCNQLLGVSRSRVGKVVNCPKCSTGLVVPDPDESPAAAAAAQQGPASGDTTPAFLAALDAGMPVELTDIRPEDIRVESDDDWSPPPIAFDLPRPAPSPEPPPFLVPLAAGANAGREESYDIASAPTPLSIQASPTAVIPVPVPQPVSAPASPVVEPLVPPIKFETPSRIYERTTTVRTRDLILPRSVVATWSLFVLMAQALAFIAGLLAGHYLWRVH